MTKLLVSVRNVWEAGEALAGGAEVIDVKEPRHGSLGAASPEMRNAVRLAVHPAGSITSAGLPSPSRSAVPLSAALGELLEYRDATAATQLDGYAYAKVGLAGCGLIDDWQQRWRGWIADLPAATASVAVVYADYRAAHAPTPWQILEAAIQTPVRTLLVDTHDKSSGDVLERMTACELADVIAGARTEGFQVALAGSITLDRLSEALRFDPDWIAVRGAVCRGGRDSVLDRELVKRFVERLSTPREPDATARRGGMIDSVTNRT